MKNKKISIIVILGLLMVSGQIGVVHSASSSVQDRAIAFIENVLPIDSSKFGIELKIDGNATDIPKEIDLNNISFSNEDKVLIYFLGSRVGTMDSLNVVLAVRNNTIYQGAIDLHTGPRVGQSSLNEAATIFLTRYQEYSGLDSTEMISMFTNVDLAQNASITLGSLTMTINRTDASPFANTEIRWVFQDSLMFDVSFQNNFPVSFYDERQIPSTTPTPTPTVPELSWLAILPLLLFMFSVAVILRNRKPINQSNVLFQRYCTYLKQI